MPEETSNQPTGASAGTAQTAQTPTLTPTLTPTGVIRAWPVTCSDRESLDLPGRPGVVLAMMLDSPDPGSGGPGSLPPRGSHRSGRARFTHPAPQKGGFATWGVGVTGRREQAGAGSAPRRRSTTPSSSAMHDQSGASATYARAFPSPDETAGVQASFR